MYVCNVYSSRSHPWEFRLSPPTPVVAERVFGRTGHLPEAAVNEPVFATVVAASRIQESVRGASRAAAPLRVETFEPRTSLQSHIYIVTVLGLVESLGILLVCYSGRYVFIGKTHTHNLSEEQLAAMHR